MGLIAHYSDLLEAGCDEAGRGCLAGPVVAGAVILKHDADYPELNDSKQLNEKKRMELRTMIMEEALAYGVGVVTAAEIDEINILNASFLAMHRVGRQLLGDLFLVEKQQMEQAYMQRDKTAFYAHSDVLYELLSDLDNLNSYHPHATLDLWLQQARDMGQTAQEKDYYESNARRLVTTWGGSLNDYACRNWSGLMWDYYGRRWENYIRELTVAVISGKEFDEAHYRAVTDRFQQQWVTSTEEISGGSPSHSGVLSFSRHLRDKYRTALSRF